MFAGLSQASPVIADDAGVTLARLKSGDEIPTQLGPLPLALEHADIKLYREIMALQQRGQWDAADALIAEVKDPILLGQVEAQRYLHPTAYRSSFPELRDWLEDYADHPQAERIYRLALRRRPKQAPLPSEPIEGYLSGSGQELLQEKPPRYRSSKKRTSAQSSAVYQLRTQILDLVSLDRPTQALRLLRSSPSAIYADEVELDLARWWIARGYFANQKYKEAFDIAIEAASRSGEHEARLHWTAGLAAWRLERYGTAFRHFSLMANNDNIEGEDVAMAAFWAARSAMRAGRPQVVAEHLGHAADASDEFYGLLAKSVIGRPISFDWHEAGLRDDTIDLLLQFDGAKRAIALHQIGRGDLSAAEIRKLAARSRPPLVKALTALAEALDLPAAQMRVAQRLRLQDGRRHDGAMFPIPEWQPASGFLIDRALTYSIARAESGFDPAARSYRGAYGLMQILPATAKRMSQKASVDYEGKITLLSPEDNLELGQVYVRHLLGTDTVDNSLLHLCLAYNGGLRRVGRWKSELDDIDDDPLLFLESIPVTESRLYTKKVMANLWAYRTRFDQPTPSLDALAKNRWPQYYSYDIQEAQLAGPY